MQAIQGARVIEQGVPPSPQSPTRKNVSETTPSLGRTLHSPIDETLSLWSEGRRAAIRELATALRRGACERYPDAARGASGPSGEDAPPVKKHIEGEHCDTGCPSTLEYKSDLPDADGEEEEYDHHREQAQVRHHSSHDSKNRTEVSSTETTPHLSTGNMHRGVRRPRASDRARSNKGNREIMPQQNVPLENQHVSTRQMQQMQQRSSSTANTESTLRENLARWDSGWRPPPLRELPRGGQGFFSGFTYMGPPDRFELVKSANRSLGAHGDGLTDMELEWAVLCMEEVEALMAAMEFSAAANILEDVLTRCPGFTLAYFRLALCILAARGTHGTDLARRLLECAMFLEGNHNLHLRASADLVLRILGAASVPDSYWSEDFPKSMGDLRALEVIVDQL